MRPIALCVSIEVFLVLFIIGGINSFFGQNEGKAKVTVVQFSNATGSASYDAACKTATETLVSTLEQLGRYRVQSADRLGTGKDALKDMADDEQVDFIMYGKLANVESGGIDCVLSVFDRAKGKTMLSQSMKAVGLPDIFEVTDNVVASMLESMMSSHMGFGSTKITVKGKKGSCRVLVDG